MPQNLINEIADIKGAGIVKPFDVLGELFCSSISEQVRVWLSEDEMRFNQLINYIVTE